MNTKTIDKAEIVAQLRNMTEEVLFGDKPWPIADNFAVHRQLVGWRLREECEITIGANGEIVERPRSPDSKKGEVCIRTTALGRELVDWWILLMGHHEPAEIPDMLADYGLLTRDEAEHIILDRWERDGEKLEDVLPPILRRVYRANEFFSAVKQLTAAVRGYLASDAGDDSDHVVGMAQSSDAVLNRAREIPALREWTQAMARAQEVELLRQQAKNS